MAQPDGLAVEPVVARFSATLSAPVGDLDAKIAMLFGVVHDYMTRARTEGLQPEVALTRFKRAIEEAGLRKNGTQTDDLIDQVISLAIR